MASLKISLLLVAAVLGSVIADLTPERQALWNISRENKKHPRLQAAEAACKDTAELDPCHATCYYKQLGMLDDSGRYVESKTAEYLAIVTKGVISQDQVNAVAKACNSINQHITPGCYRNLDVSRCMDNGVDAAIEANSRAGVRAM